MPDHERPKLRAVPPLVEQPAQPQTPPVHNDSRVVGPPPELVPPKPDLRAVPRYVEIPDFTAEPTEADRGPQFERPVPKEPKLAPVTDIQSKMKRPNGILSSLFRPDRD